MNLKTSGWSQPDLNNKGRIWGRFIWQKRILVMQMYFFWITIREYFWQQDDIFQEMPACNFYELQIICGAMRAFYG